MAQFEGSYPTGRTTSSTTEHDVSGWAVGITFFASLMLLLIGTFHLLAGFAAVLDDAFYTVRPSYALELDVTTWGWLQMGAGVVVMLAGALLLVGSMFGRIIAIAVAALSAIGNFWSIPYYPVWSILLISLDIAVIWAVTVYGRFMSEE
jgi:hypothetical protein